MTHETTDPVVKPRPVDGAEIVRLAIEWRRLERLYEKLDAPMELADLAWDALHALQAAVDTRL